MNFVSQHRLASQQRRPGSALLRKPTRPPCEDILTVHRFALEANESTRADRRSLASSATAEQRDELAPLHSITSSARANTLGGTSKPSALAVLMLSTVSYFVGAFTGRSAGFSPFRMRSSLSRPIALAPRTRWRSRPHGARRGGLGQVNSAERDVSDYNLERKRTSSTSSAGLPKRRAADTYPCVASWPGPSWPCMSSDRYTTLNVAHHAKTSEVEGEIESQIEYQEVQEGQESSAAQTAEGCCQHSGAGGCCNESSRLRRQARSRRSGVKRRRGATSF